MPNRTPPRTPGRFRGFTLIELMVVIAIIAALIAILLPSLTTARYTAKLTVCGARLQQVGVGVTSYAAGNRMSYPYRAGAYQSTWYKPNNLRWHGWDDRPALKGYLAVNSLMNCPFQEPVDLERTTDSAVFAAYNLFAGWGYQGGGEQWMLRMGDAMTHQGRRFTVLASDRLVRVGDGRGDHGTHPSLAAGQTNYVTQSVASGGLVWTESRWIGDYRSNAGAMDMNFGHTDGSVRQIANVLPYDNRLVALPEFSTGWEYPTVATFIPAN